MAKRVDKIFEDIKRLSKNEQKELLRLLPKALNVAPEDLLWARLAESSFSFWDNPEDQVYDEL
ncbi:MAG: hypothetical protein E6J89_09820 [Deltaproteobacteria bacterium]|nr:MAG: hypothetical protein E6J89_09820 [Deltaproteobacteria bacterium]